MQDFRNLRVWQAAHSLTLEIYRATCTFPSEERYGLVSQMRRAASSIGANISEGCGRGSDADTRRCFQIAFSSSCETLNHLLLARDLGYLEHAAFGALESASLDVRRMLQRLIDRLR